MTTITHCNPNLCPSYHADGENSQREDMAKVTELACRHFQHSEGMENLPDFEQICHLRKFKESLHHIERKYQHDTEVLSSLASVENLQEEEVREHEITENGKRTVPLLIDEILLGRGALRTWKEEVDRWRNIPIENWPPEFANQKPIFLMNGKLTSCPMKTFKELCLRKDYKEAIAFKTNLPILDNATKFEKRLQILEQRYLYDQEVVAAITKTKELREDVSEIFQRNPDCPLQLFPIYIISAIAGKVKDSSKTILIASILQAVLLERGMIRTQSEEVNRWKKIPIEKWPSELKENGVRFLDDDNEVKHCSLDDFEKLVAKQLTCDKVISVSCGVLLSSVVMGAAWYFYSK